MINHTNNLLSKAISKLEEEFKQLLSYYRFASRSLWNYNDRLKMGFRLEDFMGYFLTRSYFVIHFRVYKFPNGL